MTAYAMNGPNWVELQPGRDVTIDGVVSSYDTVLIWSSQMRTSRGIKAIVDDPMPAGKMAAGSSLIDDNGSPRRVWVLVDAPPPIIITAKADIWRRCTDLEAQMLDGALADAPAQLRRIFDAAQYIDHSDAFFPVLRSAITDVLGQTRADELLAGS